MSENLKKKGSLNEKLDLILNNQEKILSNEKKILGEEEKIQELEELDLKKDADLEKNELSALQELSNLEKQLKKSVSNPIKNVTKRDLFKGFIGAFVGVMGHFAFSKAADIAPTLTFYRATLLYIVAFIIIIVMLYYSGFRKIKKHIVFKFMPLRALVLYSVSIVTVIWVNLLFGKLYFPLEFTEIYNLVAASIILAVMGAGTADLIGKNE
jgi:uncharacterized membrane protein